MLSAALLLAIVGFAALIAALWAGSTVWAWICVAVAATGVILFIVDWVRHRKSKRT